MRKNRSSWAEHAACLGYDTNLWFPEIPQGRDYFAQARKVCITCPVMSDCLDFALSFDADNDRFGMFGGKSPKERAKMRDEKQRKYRQFFDDGAPVGIRPSYSYRYEMILKSEVNVEEVALGRPKTDMKNTLIPDKTRILMKNTASAPPSTLTAQASAAMVMSGWEDPLDARTCAALFMGASYVMELARLGVENCTLTPQEGAAAQGVAEVAMQVWKYHAEMAREDS